MRFTRYRMCIIKNESNNLEKLQLLDEKDVFNRLNLSSKITDLIGEFAIPRCKFENHIIVGNLSQTYGIQLMKFLEDSKEEIPIMEDRANDNKTYFFINCKENCIYIQNRKYTPKELNPNLTVTRLEQLLNKYLYHDVFETIVLRKENINYKIDELQNFFRTSYVRSVEFINISDCKLKPGTKLHNPRIDLDDAVIESWNNYSSDNVESIKIKAKKDKSIAKNPIANIGFKLAEQNENRYEKIIKNMEVIQGGQKEILKPIGNEYLVVPISDKDKTTDETIDKILNHLKKRKL